jgi:hypothetical protein
MQRFLYTETRNNRGPVFYTLSKVFVMCLITRGYNLAGLCVEIVSSYLTYNTPHFRSEDQIVHVGPKRIKNFVLFKFFCYVFYNIGNISLWT